MTKGDIVLVTFPFTNLSGSKLRPAVVLFATSLDFTACFITTKIELEEKSDLFLSSNTVNGLKKDSVIRISKIATIDRQLAKGLLGKLSPEELNDFNLKLKSLLKLP